MKIAFYCQHVLGVGHFFRSLEICRALTRHQVFLITGGVRPEAALAPHVTEVRLPALEMDREFKGLRAAPGADLDAIRRRRRERLAALFQTERPDLFLVELYPFGRKAFGFEIDPVLDAMAVGRLPRCGVVCSVRDILVEKADAEKHEARAVGVLNRFFDAVLIHADPRLVRLEETFGRLKEVAVPLIYTGFITPAPAADARQRLRTALGLAAADRLIVVSAGGGSVGMPLLEAAVRAARHLRRARQTRLQVFTGPFLSERDFEQLAHAGGEGVSVARFTSDFLSYLAAADLSVSMAGYNTTMNLLAARAPALVWPFAQNREQRLRSERLETLGALQLLQDADLEPVRLAALMDRRLDHAGRPEAGLDLDGARAAARWIDAWRPAAGSGGVP
jgi:predicted glycosyltransferase